MLRALARHTLLMGTFFAFVLIGLSPAAAQMTVDDVPQGFDTVIGVNFDEIRESPLYDRAITMARSQPGIDHMLAELESSMDIDISTDLTSLLVASEFPPLNQRMLSSPAAAMQGAAQGSGNTFAVVTGAFDSHSILQKLSEDHDGERPLDLDGRNTTLVAMDSDKLAIFMGDGSFRDGAMDLLSTTGALDDKYQQGLQSLGDRSGIFLLTSPNIDDEELAEEADASFVGLAMSGGPRNVHISTLVTLSDEESASAMLEEVDEARTQAAQNPLISLFGVRPLLDNLSLQQDGHHVFMETTMPNRNALRLAQRLGNILENQAELQQPLGNDGDD